MCPAHFPIPSPSPQGKPLSIVIVTIGSRGDVQPFIALGLELVAQGHSVRLAAHAVFEEFVAKAGEGRLEFYPLPGDPKALMQVMTEHDFLSYGFFKVRHVCEER